MEQEIRALPPSELTGVDEEKYLTTVSSDMSLFLDRKEVRCRTGFEQMTEVPRDELATPWWNPYPHFV